MLTLEQFHSGLANGSLARAHHIRLSDGLTEFPAALYQLAETLEILDLSGNRLSTLPDDLTRFARLRIADLTDSRDPVLVAGIPLDFILFGLTLLGVAL